MVDEGQCGHLSVTRYVDRENKSGLEREGGGGRREQRREGEEKRREREREERKRRNGGERMKTMYVHTCTHNTGEKRERERVRERDGTLERKSTFRRLCYLWQHCNHASEHARVSRYSSALAVSDTISRSTENHSFPQGEVNKTFSSMKPMVQVLANIGNESQVLAMTASTLFGTCSLFI